MLHGKISFQKAFKTTNFLIPCVFSVPMHKSKHNKSQKDKSGDEKPKQWPKTWYGKVWYFLWEDNSIWSWIANLVLAFILIKFVVYPGLGLMLGTSYPVVAVVSGSMHHETNFDEFYSSQQYLYDQYSISKYDFSKFPYTNGFNKGDIMVLKGTRPENIKVGDVLVFRTNRPDPVIHRVVEIKQESGKYFFHTKGDHNLGSLPEELSISQERVIGRAAFRIPTLGWVKIWFSQLFGFGG